MGWAGLGWAVYSGERAFGGLSCTSCTMLRTRCFWVANRGWFRTLRLCLASENCLFNPHRARSGGEWSATQISLNLSCLKPPVPLRVILMRERGARGYKIVGLSIRVQRRGNLEEQAKGCGDRAFRVWAVCERRCGTGCSAQRGRKGGLAGAGEVGRSRGSLPAAGLDELGSRV